MLHVFTCKFVPNMFRFILFLLLCVSVSVNAQSKFLMGPELGFTISRTDNNDTFANNFSRRNKIGPRVGAAFAYNLGAASAIDWGVYYAGKGYKINNDTLGVSPSVSKTLHSIEIPLGLSFRQQLNSGSFISEKFGIIGSYVFRDDSMSTRNSTSNTAFKVLETSASKIYPMFYLGVKMGGYGSNKNRYEFGFTYMQSLARDANLSVQYGSDFKKSFPLIYRGGYLSAGFTYYFNAANFKVDKSDYFID